MPPQPDVMTWGKARGILVLCGVFDAVRFFFLLLIFFAPTIARSQAGVVGEAIAFGASPFILIFGIIMSLAVAFLGMLVVALLLALTNPRIFIDNIARVEPAALLGFFGSLVGAAAWLYLAQIRNGRAELKEWRTARAAAARRSREDQIAMATADFNQRMERAQMEEVANGNATEAANENEEIPDELREAA